MSKVRNWVLKFFNKQNLCMIVCSDGYCLDENGHKIFVLKKSSMEMINDLINNFTEVATVANCYSDRSVKCNGNNKFESNNIGLIDELTGLIFKASHIKNPPEFFDEAINEINRLLSEENFDIFIKEHGVATAVEQLFC